jgi:hypothetical protein
MISKTQLNTLRIAYLKQGDAVRAQALFAARKLMQAKLYQQAKTVLARYGIELESHPGQDSTWPVRELGNLKHVLGGKSLPRRWVYQNLKGGIESQGSRKNTQSAPSVSRKYFDHSYGQGVKK